MKVTASNAGLARTIGLEPPLTRNEAEQIVDANLSAIGHYMPVLVYAREPAIARLTKEWSFDHEQAARMALVEHTPSILRVFG
jgi:hypothetical protein